MQNQQQYIYLAIGAVIIIALAFFVFGNSANAPTNDTDAAEQATTTEDETSSGEAETQSSETAQHNESDMEFAREMAGASGEESDVGSANTGSGTVSSEQASTETTSAEATSSEAPQESATANWRAYINNSFGVRFEIPPEWRVSENSRPGEFTMQAYSGDVDNKTAEFNLLFYPAELDRAQEGNFAETVNGKEAYVETNTCPADVRCVLKKVIFPLENGEITGNTWSGDVLEISLIAGGIATNATRSTLNNILDSLTFTTN